MVNLILTNSYYNLFPTLVNLIKPDVKSLSKRNVIFCEAKISLMVERAICDKFGGSFNTDVYSFGNYLRKNKKFDKLLTKEGSVMVIGSPFLIWSIQSGITEPREHITLP